MTHGDILEAIAALTLALALFIIATVVVGPAIGLGVSLVVIAAYLGYVAQFVTGRIGS